MCIITRKKPTIHTNLYYWLIWLLKCFIRSYIFKRKLSSRLLLPKRCSWLWFEYAWCLLVTILCEDICRCTRCGVGSVCEEICILVVEDGLLLGLWLWLSKDRLCLGRLLWLEERILLLSSKSWRLIIEYTRVAVVLWLVEDTGRGLGVENWILILLKSICRLECVERVGLLLLLVLITKRRWFILLWERIRLVLVCLSEFECILLLSTAWLVHWLELIIRLLLLLLAKLCVIIGVIGKGEWSWGLTKWFILLEWICRLLKWILRLEALSYITLHSSLSVIRELIWHGPSCPLLVHIVAHAKIRLSSLLCRHVLSFFFFSCDSFLLNLLDFPLKCVGICAASC